VLSLNKRHLSAWILSIPLTYGLTGLLDNFYPSSFAVFLLAAIFQTLAGIFMFYLLGRVQKDFHAQPFETGLTLFLFVALTFFPFALFLMARQFPALFDPSLFLLDVIRLFAFLFGAVLALPTLVWIINFAEGRKFSTTGLYRFVAENLNGLLVAFLFFVAYLLLASIFNRPAFSSDDIFFDADGNLWRGRFATENVRDYYWRPAHPFVLIIIRPLVEVLSLFFKGDHLFAALTLNALAGALCVYLVWMFVRATVGNQFYAMLIAVMFGASAAQIAFSSIIETYIYLALAALIFILMLLKDKPLPALVLTGLAAFGITISNIVQTAIAHFLVRRNLWQVVAYTVVITALVVPLSLLNNYVYPESQPYFWDLSTLQAEGHNSFLPTPQRANYLGRVMFLHSMVAPEPLTFKEEIPFLKVWMFRAAIKKEPMRIAQYESWLGNSAAFFWAGLILLGGWLFLKNLFKQDQRFPFAFAGTILFFFALHMQYGKDVFLYSANWTYAIVLFLALAWKEWAERRWFQLTLLVFTLILMANNSQLVLAMLKSSAMYIK